MTYFWKYIHAFFIRIRNISLRLNFSWVLFYFIFFRDKIGSISLSCSQLFERLIFCLYQKKKSLLSVLPITWQGLVINIMSGLTYSVLNLLSLKSTTFFSLVFHREMIKGHSGEAHLFFRRSVWNGTQTISWHHWPDVTLTSSAQAGTPWDVMFLDLPVH